MSKINQIQNAIRELSAGGYQKLMDAYLYKHFQFKNIMPLGSHTGTDKTTKGTPDSFVVTDKGKYILIAYGTVGEQPFTKIEKDIVSCLDKTKTGIDISDVEQIICCHTSTNITPGQYTQICSHFQNVLLIGIEDVSLDLYLKYSSIAKDFLSIDIDTHQIFDKSEYIENSSKYTYSTPLDMPLLCREKEVAEISNKFDNENVVIIAGRSGVGKTRLALEVAEIYETQKLHSVKIIKSNNLSIYNDFQSTFIDDKDFFVVVDDADQLTELKYLLEYCISAKRKHHLRILITVRDYAKEIVINRVKPILIPFTYTLNPLTDDNIKHVLKVNLGIVNDDFIQQILQISKGSIRLAIMAGKSALANSYKSIKNVFDIFDVYFSDIMKNIDHDEIIVASLIAFFSSLTLNSEEKPIKLAEMLGINFGRFVDICRSLHQKEIVSIFNNLAVRFEDQNLRDYLLYYVFFNMRWIAPSQIILYAFPQFRKQIVYAFNTIINLFETEENLLYIELEIKKAWIEVKKQPDRIVLEFVATFHSVIPDDSLLILKDEIEQLPEKHTDFSVYDFEKGSNNHTIRSEIIQILIGFKFSICFEESLNVMFYYLERNTEYPMDFFFLFGEILGFN